jgi:hypothetical protein
VSRSHSDIIAPHLGRLFWRRSVLAPTIAFAAFVAVSAHARPEQGVATVTIDPTPGHQINSFDPDAALGSSIDVLSHRDIDLVYTPHIIQESLSAGWGPITYRNNSELRMAAWHWNPRGVWSDPEHNSGYFTGSSELGEPIRYILEYALPHRGFSTSGDAPVEGPNLSYWKSNPYLTSKFTGESDSLHPQWVVVDLKATKPIDAVRIAWANPYARTYSVEYWEGTDALDFDAGPKGAWIKFPSGSIRDSSGGMATLALSGSPLETRFLRVWMTESSNTCDLHGADDIRNCVGYAIQDIRAGRTEAGQFIDVSRNAAYCSSSIDPWHTAGDLNATGRGQHTGFDMFFSSGLTNNLPALIPISLLYGTPEEAASQISYMNRLG